MRTEHLSRFDRPDTTDPYGHPVVDEAATPVAPYSRGAGTSRALTLLAGVLGGAVLVIMGAKDEDEAVKIANDTPYGLAGYVSAGTVERARKVGRQIRAGNVNLNGVPNERTAPFGGYKQSGNGREWGKFGLEEYLEVKAVAMYNDAVKLAREAGDNASSELFERLLRDEEEHVDFLEAQLHQIKEIGYERYLSIQVGGGEQK